MAGELHLFGTRKHSPPVNGGGTDMEHLTLDQDLHCEAWGDHMECGREDTGAK